jgi:hypothetical protein
VLIINENSIYEEQVLKLGKLHPFEVWLLRKIREDFRFGEITIVVQDGVPQRIKVAQYNLSPKNYGKK